MKIKNSIFTYSIKNVYLEIFSCKGVIKTLLINAIIGLHMLYPAFTSKNYEQVIRQVTLEVLINPSIF